MFNWYFIKCINNISEKKKNIYVCVCGLSTIHYLFFHSLGPNNFFICNLISISIVLFVALIPKALITTIKELSKILFCTCKGKIEK